MAEVVVRLLLNETYSVPQWEAQGMQEHWDPMALHFFIGAGMRPWEAVFSLLEQMVSEVLAGRHLS